MQEIVNDTIILKQLQELLASGGHAALFVEDSGLGNENGTITALYKNADGFWVEMDGGRRFQLNNVMAVNGLFRTGFSTC